MCFHLYGKTMVQIWTKNKINTEIKEQTKDKIYAILLIEFNNNWLDKSNYFFQHFLSRYASSLRFCVRRKTKIMYLLFKRRNALLSFLSDWGGGEFFFNF